MEGPTPGGDPFPPWILIRPEPDPDGTPPAPGAGAAALGLLPGGQAACNLGVGNLAIGSDGQVLFSQYFAEQTALEFGRNGCEDVVTYPPEADGTASR